MADKWNELTEMPPDEVLQVMDEKGNTAFGQPTYYPFEVMKMAGDEKKRWGWRGTVVPYEKGETRWDGGWLVNVGMEVNKFGNVKYWRLNGNRTQNSKRYL